MKKSIVLVVLFAFMAMFLSGCSSSALGKMQQSKPFIWKSGQPNQNEEHEREHEHEDNGKHKGEYKNKHENKHEHGHDD